MSRRSATVQARDPDRLIPDPAGFFVVCPDARRERLVVEQYTVAAVLDCIIAAGCDGAAHEEKTGECVHDWFFAQSRSALPSGA